MAGCRRWPAAPEAGGYLGDVIISYPRAVAQAAEMGHGLDLELHLLIVHGLLHLLGWDHENERDAVRMEARERQLLARVGRVRP